LGDGRGRYAGVGKFHSSDPVADGAIFEEGKPFQALQGGFHNGSTPFSISPEEIATHIDTHLDGVISNQFNQ